MRPSFVRELLSCLCTFTQSMQHPTLDRDPADDSNIDCEIKTHRRHLGDSIAEAIIRTIVRCPPMVTVIICAKQISFDPNPRPVLPKHRTNRTRCRPDPGPRLRARPSEPLTRLPIQHKSRNAQGQANQKSKRAVITASKAHSRFILLAPPLFTIPKSNMDRFDASANHFSPLHQTEEDQVRRETTGLLELHPFQESMHRLSTTPKEREAVRRDQDRPKTHRGREHSTPRPRAYPPPPSEDDQVPEAEYSSYHSYAHNTE